jgi:hypothetical protein
MSQENVEVMRGLVEAWNRGDMDTYRELASEFPTLLRAAFFLPPGPDANL